MQPSVSVPKIFLRGNRWYVRVQVPKEMQEYVKKIEYWVSLKTENRAEALQRATEVTRNKRIDLTRAFEISKGLTRIVKELSAEQKVALARECYHIHCVPDVDIKSEFESGRYRSFREFMELREKATEEVILELRSTKIGQISVQKMATNLMHSNGINAPTDSVAYQEILEICMHSFVEAKRNELARLKGRRIHAEPDPNLVDPDTGAPKEYEPLGRTLAEPIAPEPLLSDLVEQFLDNPNKLRTQKTKNSIRGYMKVVIEILGDSTPLESITEADCERVRDLLRELPPNFSKMPALRDRTFDEMVRIARSKNMGRLSPTGVNNYLKWLTTFLNWCQKKGKIARVPTSFGEISVADPERKEHKRLPFTDEQLQTYFHSRIFSEQERSNCIFWVSLIALWNGMRSNEICQLDVADVVEVEGIWGFDITYISTAGDDDKSVKTGASIRLIPIHPKLIDFGFLDFHASRPAGSKLFGDVTRGADGYYSSTFSKKSNRYLQEVGVHGPKRKFHSFRHNFRDALRRGRVDREIGKALGGWQRGNTDAFDIYGSGFPLDELADELGRVDYPKVGWGHLVI